MTFSRIIKTGGALVFAAIVAVGCSSTQTAGQQVDDATITAGVKAALAADPDVKSFGIDVDTIEGVVALRGNVQTSAQKSETERLARTVGGVRGVRNEIHVGAGDSVGTHIDDAGITASVKTAFAADPEVKALSIDVDTRDGVVTLSGRVETASMRARAEDLARHTSGVKSVRNELMVGDHS
jgi:hyperosmotically inducible protein